VTSGTDTSAPVEPERRARRLTLAQREQRLAWYFVAPAAVIVLSLVVFPVLWNAALSLQRVRLIELQNFSFFDFDAGLGNYSRVTGVRDFWETFRVTIMYTVFGTLLSLGLGVWAALVVKKAFIGRSVVRGFMLFPYVAPVIAVTFVWRLMLSTQFGIVNEWIRSGGGTQIDFLGSRDFTLSVFGWHLTLPLALSMVILFEAWRYFPFAFLFILARLQAMPDELDEAARVDGATLSQRFRYITLPQLRGVLSVLFLLRFIWTFNKFDDIFLLTGGAAGTKVVTVGIIEWLRARGDIGSAAALSIILAAVLILLLLVYFKWFYTEEVEE
jgi:multiple sugar transport system permease protein